MIRIAVVGNIGSGKSYVAKQFGFPVFSADNEVSKLYKKNRKCYKKLRRILPQHINSFPISKKKLSEAILSNTKNIKKITKIIHPEIQNKMKSFIKKNKKKKIIILDIPLLMENNINKRDDILVFVDAPQKTINNKLRKRSNFNAKIVNKFKKLQLSVELKRKKSDYIIKNNFKSKSVKKNVKRILREILLNARSNT